MATAFRKRPIRLIFRPALVFSAQLFACSPTDINQSIPAPIDSFSFPVDLTLDPRLRGSQQACGQTDECGSGENCVDAKCVQPPRWLFVANADADRSYDGGTIQAIDLDRFFAALEPFVGHTFANRSQELVVGRSQLAAAECGHSKSQPALIECDEKAFIDSAATAEVGKFISSMVAWTSEDNSVLRLLTTVRGDPSISYVDVSGGLDSTPLKVNCSNSPSNRKCADRFILNQVEGGEKDYRIDLEPYKAITAQSWWQNGEAKTSRPLLIVGHRGSSAYDVGAITLGSVTDEVVVQDGAEQTKPRLLSDVAAFPQGVGGIAVRPCDPALAPLVTDKCNTPLVYVAPFSSSAIWMMGILQPTLNEKGEACVFNGANPSSERSGCNEVIQALESFPARGPISDDALLSNPPSQTFGDLAFTKNGNVMAMLHTRPSMLVAIDTSLDPMTSMPYNRSLGAIEICDEPTGLVLVEESDRALAIVSCFAKAELAVVDLTVMELVTQIRVGTGPAHLVVDRARELVFSTNFLESTISVVDLSRARVSRFSEIARLGLQEPFKQ